MRSTTVCMQWPTLGPYHVARVRALDRTWSERDIRVQVLETASTDRMYQWDSVDRSVFEVRTVFPGKNFDDLRPASILTAVRAALDDLNPDIVVTNSYAQPDARGALAWAVANTKRAILTTDSQYDDYRRSGWREWAKSQIVSLYGAAVVAGKRHVEYVTATLGVEPSSVFTGLDVVDNLHFEVGARRSRGKQIAQASGGESPGPYFLFCGRLAPEKNILALLDAYAAYRSGSTDPWPLVIVGDGELRDKAEDLCRLHGIEDVLFAGKQSYADLPDFYGNAGALVLPSTREPWGLVVNEAMASGLPVLVSSACGCADDLVHDGKNGFVFDSTKPDETTDALLRLASLPIEVRRQFGETSKAIIAEWDLARFASAMDSAVRYAVETPSSRPLLGRVVLSAANRFAPAPGA